MHILFPARIGAAAIILGSMSASALAQLEFTEAASQVKIEATQTFPAGFSSIMIGGAAAGDFNRDGWSDLFVLGGGGVSDHLYINNGDGTFADRAAEWGIDTKHVGIGPAVGDYDNDGWLDLFVSSIGPSFEHPLPGRNLLYHNNGGTGFTEVAVQAGVATTAPVVGDSFGAAFGDYDLDGDLDLFVCGYVPGLNGNHLFRNDGNGRFTDVTSTALPFDFAATMSHGFGPRMVDMDGDRYPELLYVGDFHTSRYFINNRDGTFTDGTLESGTAADYNGMGNTVGDFNGDGLLDWYVTAIYNLPVEPLKPGSMLYLNQGNHRFVESGEAAGVRRGGWGWGTTAIDLDQDGDLDLVATNGWMGIWATDPTNLWLNDGAASFTQAATQCGINHTDQGRALLAFDPDNDGDEDLVIFNLTNPLSYYRNDLAGEDTHWLKVWLDNSRRTNIAPDGFGAKIWLTAGGKTQFRHIDFGTNYLSQNELSAHFGLGNIQVIDSLRVEWPTGEVTELYYPPVDQSITVYAATLQGDITGDGRVRLEDLGVLLSAYGSCDGDAGFVAAADLQPDGCIAVDDLSVVLSMFGRSLY